MVFVGAWVLQANCPPLRVTSVCSSILLWIYCRKRKPCVRSFGWTLAVCVFPLLVPIMMVYIGENWHIILIDLLVMWDRVKPQSPTPVLNVADGATAFFTHAFPGSGFQLHWSPSAQQLSVSGDGHELWRTRASQPFVAIAGATSLVTEDSGNFKFKDRIEWQCVAQRLESVEAVPSGSGSAAIVRGRFDDGSTQCTGLEWQMRFSVSLRCLNLHNYQSLCSLVIRSWAIILQRDLWCISLAPCALSLLLLVLLRRQLRQCSLSLRNGRGR
jgi:hypothetical protein